MKVEEIKIDELPGYREAVAEESQARSEAFLPSLRRFICGVEVFPLSFAHVNLLNALKSPFMSRSNGMPSPLAIAEFLWVISPQYQLWLAFRERVGSRHPWYANWRYNRARRSFVRSMRRRRIPWAVWVAHIYRYLDRAFSDSPAGGGRQGFFANYYSAEASVINIIASSYGWSDDKICEIPVEKLWQYIRCIQRRNDPNMPMSNPSDRIRQVEFEKLKERIKKESNGHG